MCIVNESIKVDDFVALKLELENVLDRKVNLVEFDAIKPRIKERILKEYVVII